ncbi:Dolichyl-phosphate-mannose-protein mannosyltransferase [Dyadobacter soli]|uniref:Dolichyl-phosphate-mannose-protein mannosyltransferase n=1 Tax=Dyadobacter soli TaxID=659014 RepID=A0A1G6ZTN2_9BACT|nr:glycosyltransferase family 39 protein [Dyadobacter soli]SDE06038.1 Dolichyl-phosphate-mannose-protein mannosyltransferase [Dyadobacter soli]
MLQKDLLKITKWGLGTAVLIWMIGWLMLIPEDMSAQIAAISAETVKNGRLVEKTGVSGPIISLSVGAMRLFGINQLSLHIPGFLAILFSLFCVYRLANSLAGKESAVLSVLILATSQATFLVSNELSDASYLAACFIFAIWQISSYIETRKIANLLLALLGVVGLVFVKNAFPDSASQWPIDPLLTLLITFCPWTIFLILALIDLVQRLIFPDYHKIQKREMICLITIIMPFVFSYVNPFRATFDIFMAYPVASVVTAMYIIRRLESTPDTFSGLLAYVHAVAAYAALALLFSLVWFTFPADNYYGLVHFMALLSVLTWLIFFSPVRNKLIVGCVVFSIGANIVLTTYFYPNIYEYQAAAKLGIVARANGAADDRLFSYQAGTPYSLRFYSGVHVTEVNDFGRLVGMKDCLVYTHQNLLGEFKAIRPDLKILGSCEEYPRRILDFRFLDPNTRASYVQSKVLIKL